MIMMTFMNLFLLFFYLAFSIDLTQDQLEKANQGYQQPELYGEPVLYEGEVFFENLRQLTFGGENAEAYWSPDGKKLVFQSKRDGSKSDSIYMLSVESMTIEKLSSGKGVTTCAWWLSDSRRIIFASTHETMPEDPPPPDYSKGYVWPVHSSYEIYLMDTETKSIEKLTESNGYDAEGEGIIWQKNNTMIFTSSRDGDLDLYSMEIDGDRSVTRLTHEPGYDGGSIPGYSGEYIIWRRTSANTEEEIKDFKDLLADDLVRPSQLDIWMMRSDGTHRVQITDNGAANFGPSMAPNDKFIFYVSNVDDPQGRDFDIYMHHFSKPKGAEDEKITFFEGFDGFPVFSPSGEYVVFASNRNGLVEGETNLFIADWIGPSSN
tara:strand:- start:9774 stop:10901 length:1128 start_codon:yes stop_codon:yes gene_type:complete